MSGLASHPGGSRNTPSCFMLQKPEISTSPMGLSRLITETLRFKREFLKMFNAASRGPPIF